MNFGEICTAVFDEINGRPVVFASTDLGRDIDGELIVSDPTQRNVIRWVRDAYRKINYNSDQWSFLHQRGTFLELRPGEDTYEKDNGKVGKYSLYSVRPGQTARTPVSIMEYSWWVENERGGPTTRGGSVYLVETPTRIWKVWPVPVYEQNVVGDWWARPSTLLHVGDTPVWAEEFHELLIWEAVKLFAAEFGQEGAGPALMTRYAETQPALWNRFKQRYLPMIGNPEYMRW
jgi:hypothetical protein